MRKFVIAFVLSFAALTALLTVTADAQGWKRGAAALAEQNFTPIEQAACRG